MSRRKYLTLQEVSAVLETLSTGKYYIRNRCLVYMAFIHGLRVSELISLKLSDIDLSSGVLYVHRLKNGYATQHPMSGEEKGVLNSWLEERGGWLSGGEVHDWLFITRRRQRLSRQQVYHIVRNAGRLAGLPVGIHPHMFRHACGYFLAGRGADTRLIQDYLGHRNIRHTVLYTAGCASRFQGLWPSVLLSVS
ncbi:TPA: tyrosine-type recombinase/integrase [Citrobacter werkmanii]|nr:tyrosine-type recombinase/integrase [Citrobacter werkmanii]